MKQISQHLKDYSCFVACDRTFDDGKKPMLRSKTNDWNDHLICYDRANGLIHTGQNIGLCAGHGLIIIDCDSPLLVDAVRLMLPKTYEEETTSKGIHFIYEYHGDFPNKNINFNGQHLGEIRTLREYVIISPSIAKSKIDGKFHEYHVIEDIKPALLKDDDLNAVILRFNPKKLLSESPKTTGGYKRDGVDRSRYDFAKCCELIEQGFDSFGDVCSQMQRYGSSKWRERGITYQRMTFENALRNVRRVAQ